MSLAQQVRVRRLGCTGQALRHDDLIAHNVLFSSADAKWCGHLRTLVADVTDDVRCVCTFANEDLSLPLKTDVLTMRVQRLSSKLVTFKCPTCAKHYTFEVWYRKHLSRCPQAARAIMSKLDIDKSSVYKAFTLAGSQPTFINVTPAGHPCIPAGIHRPSVVSGRRINSVEHSSI